MGPAPALDAATVHRISRFLLPGERVLYCRRQHGFSVVPAAWAGRKWLLVALTVALAFWLLAWRSSSGLALAVVAALLVFVAGLVVEWLSTRFVMTEKRVMLITEPLPVNVRFIALSRVTNVRFAQGPLGRMLGYGTFGIDNAGDAHPLHELKYTRQTGELYRILSDQLFSDDHPQPPDPDDGPANRHTRPVPRLPPD